MLLGRLPTRDARAEESAKRGARSVEALHVLELPHRCGPPMKLIALEANLKRTFQRPLGSQNNPQPEAARKHSAPGFAKSAAPKPEIEWMEFAVLHASCDPQSLRGTRRRPANAGACRPYDRRK